ncbi:MAG TPA: sulfurtransferase TusA family protein [Anaeromyxobacteraceae bacterium]|nr:sulfurtransferase TusA family protein [Anaeromyxobacteraceae bacterium]
MNLLDIRAYVCPMTWVKAKIALDGLAPGDSLEVLLRDGEPLENLPRTAEEEGHSVALRERAPEAGADAWRVVLVKGAGEISKET